MLVMLWGAPCSGKTTLANMLGDHFSAPVVNEYATEYFLNHGDEKFNQPMHDIQRHFGYVQRNREADAYDNCSQIAISDSPSGLSWIYSVIRFDSSEQLNKHNFKTSSRVAENTYQIFLDCLRAEVHFYLDIVDPYAPSKHRITPEPVARKLDKQIRAVLEMHNVKLHHLTGPIDQRFDEALKII